LNRNHSISGSRSGQGLIESCIVVALVCLIFFGVFQISQLFSAQEVLDYAAGRGARARTVGFNHFMIEKTIRVGAIPNAGRLVNPVPTGGPSGQYALESARIPLYLAGENEGRLRAILDYAAWGTIIFGASSSLGDGTLRQDIQQEVSLTNNPFHRAFYASDTITLNGGCTLDEHYTLYMDDAGLGEL
jgi:hypothetical protein